ncbi:MAG: HyaD/HybD family hydrogenase maturation endopeptidase [Anaerolineae bacterium]
MEEHSTAKTLILGVGNLLVSDEGVGLRILERLAATYELPEEVQTLDGGTLGLDLLYYLEGVKNLLIFDAVEMGKQPGALIRLEGDEVPSFLSVKISPHQIGIPDMLFAAKLRDLYPQELVLWGVQPGVLEMGLKLSPPVAAQVEVVVEKAVEELTRWGVPPTPRDPQPEAE